MRVQTGGDRVKGVERCRVKRMRLGDVVYPRVWKALLALTLAGALLLLAPGVVQRGATLATGGAHLIEGYSAAITGDGLAQWDDSFSWTAEYGQALPEGFASEVLALEGIDAMVSERGPVVGYCVDDVPEGAKALVENELTGKGWTAVESGSDVLQTFVKGSGCYRWASVSYTCVGEAMSVVVVAKGVEVDE